MARRDTATDDERYVGWRDADMRAARRAPWRRRPVRWLAVAVAVTGFVVLMMEIQRDPNRCHQNCFDGSDNTFEAGHVWTAYASSWQWDAQLAIGWLACLVSLWALWAAGRKSWWQTVASLGLSVALIAAWIVWVTVQPPPGRLA
jgi:hypothetical protein